MLEQTPQNFALVSSTAWSKRLWVTLANVGLHRLWRRTRFLAKEVKDLLAGFQLKGMSLGNYMHAILKVSVCHPNSSTTVLGLQSDKFPGMLSGYTVEPH